MAENPWLSGAGGGPGGGSTAGAKCALHPEQNASGICSRCGNFMCTTCTEGGTYDACPKCRALTGDVPGWQWNRQNVQLDGPFNFAWNHFKREWVMISLAVLVMFVVIFGVSFVLGLFAAIGDAIDPIVGAAFRIPVQLATSAVQMCITAGLGVMLYRVFKGQAADIGVMFGEFGRIGTFIVAVLIQFALIIPLLIVVAIPAGIAFAIGGDTNREAAILIGAGIGALLVVVPAFWVLLPFQLLPFEVALGGETSAVQAVKNCFAMAKDNRLWMFLYALIAGLITAVGVLVCCIGILPAAGLAQMLMLGLYLMLRNGSGLPAMRGSVG